MLTGLRRFLARLTRPQADPEARTRIGSPRTLSGMWVDQETALRNATVWACIRFLSSAVAQLPWRVVQEAPGGGMEKVPTHPVDRLLFRRPNAEMGPFTFRETMMGHALLWGNAYAEIESDNAGRPIGLWPIRPSRVQVRRDVETMRLVYRVWSDDAAYTDLPPERIFHLRGFGPDVVGLSVIEYAAQSIGWAQATELFGAAFFGNGMTPSGVIESTVGLGPEGKRALEEEMARLYGGVANAHRTAILDAGMTWKPITQDAEKAQLVETMQHQVEHICRWFGVPPHKVMHLLRATFSNIEHQSIEVVKDAVVPWVERFEDEADWKLFGANRQGLQTQMDLNGLLRGDSQARAEFYSKLFQTAALSPNQILALEGMNGIGPAGDARFVPANMVPLDVAAGLRAPVAAPAPPASTPQPPAGDPLPAAMMVH